MDIFFATMAVTLLFLMLPYFGRVVLGPSVFDRLVAFNGLGTKLPLLLILIGVLFERVDMFVDLAMTLLLLSFYTTLLIARYTRKSQKAGHSE